MELSQQLFGYNLIFEANKYKFLSFFLSFFLFVYFFSFHPSIILSFISLALALKTWTTQSLNTSHRMFKGEKNDLCWDPLCPGSLREVQLEKR